MHIPSRFHSWAFAGALAAVGQLPSLALADDKAGAGTATDAEIDPPEPPPPTVVQPPPGSQPPPPAEDESSALGRYQYCFQRMIDLGVTDNAYMKRCLGIEDRQPRRTTGAQPVFLTKPDVRRVVDEGLPGIKDCYAKLLAKTKDLGVTPQGVIEARFAVKAEGTVEGVAFESGAIADVTLLTCVRDRINAWKFPKVDADPGEPPTKVHVALRLATRGARQANVTVGKGFPKVENPGAGLAPDDVLAVFRKNAPKLRECYDELLKRHKAAPKSPEPQGRVGVDVKVDPRGRVGSVKFRELGLSDRVFKKCLTVRLKSWRFPKPLGGEPFLVKFPPFVFQPARAAPTK
jgi:hypothetical protein